MKRWQPLILVLALSGCAASSGDVANESLGAPEKVCVNVRSITSFDAIDDRHLYIEARGQQKHFLFTMHGTCVRLRSAYTIAVESTLSRVCSNSFGEIIYNEGGQGFGVLPHSNYRSSLKQRRCQGPGRGSQGGKTRRAVRT